jgi:hypothetical protein
MNPASIIPLSRAHTITTGFQGTKIYTREPPGRSGLQLTLLWFENGAKLTSCVQHSVREQTEIGIDLQLPGLPLIQEESITS